MSLQLRLIDDTLNVSNAPDNEIMAPTAGSIGGSTADSRTFGSVINASKVRSSCINTAVSAASQASAADRQVSVDEAGAPTAAGSGGSDVCSDRAGRRFFPWCGWLIDVASCEVRPHLARARQVAARERAPPRGHVSLVQITRSLCKSVKPKLHKAFLDPQAMP